MLWKPTDFSIGIRFERLVEVTIMCAEECGKNVMVPVIQSYLLALSHTPDHLGKQRPGCLHDNSNLHSSREWYSLMTHP